MQNTSSNFLSPYRAVGYVTDGSPLHLRRLGSTTFITSTVDNAFQIFNADHLRLALVSPPLIKGGKVVAIGMTKKYTLIATESLIQVYNRVTFVKIMQSNSGVSSLNSVVEDGMESETESENDNENIKDVTSQSEEEEMRSRKKRRRYNPNVRNQNINKSTIRSHPGRLISLLVIGPIFLSLCDQGLLRIWNSNTLEHITDISIPGDFSQGGVLMHPHTYINKIVIGDSKGNLTLWNIKSAKKIHSFRCIQEVCQFNKVKESRDPNQVTSPAITRIEQSPVLDTIAVGFNNGMITLMNLKYDKILFNLRQASSVTGLSFRTDSVSNSNPMLVSSGMNGNIYMWDVEKRQLRHQITDAHLLSITTCHFLPQEPVLVTSSPDNSIKMWIFDDKDGNPRLLRSREGHSSPPTNIEYYGGQVLASISEGMTGAAYQLISAGMDKSIRVFNMMREAQSIELSQGPIAKRAKKLHIQVEELKLPPILAFASIETRERDWSNIISCHENCSSVYVWSFDRRCIGNVVLRQPGWPGSELSYNDPEEYHATCVAMSPCGNYGFAGTKGGVIYRYNVQSGLSRGMLPKYPAFLLEETANKKKKPRAKRPPGSIEVVHKKITGMSLEETYGPKASSLEMGSGYSADDGHRGAVKGVVVDPLNKVIISGGIDGQVKFWDFNSHQLLKTVDLSVYRSHSKTNNSEEKNELSVQVSKLKIGGENSLVTVATNISTIVLIDYLSYTVVRELTCLPVKDDHLNPSVKDFCFSRDGRRILSIYEDKTLRIFDLPTATLVDWCEFKYVPTSIAISPSGEYVCTTHENRVGLALWNDRSFFHDIPLGKKIEKPVILEDPMLILQNDSENKKPSSAIMQDSIEDDAEEDGNDEFSKKLQEITKSGQESRKQQLVSFSSLPRAHWQTLFNLELIKKRNKPIAPPQAPERAPFFLTTVYKKGEVNPTFSSLHEKTTDNNIGEESKAEVRRSKENDRNESLSSNQEKVGETDNDSVGDLAQAWSDDEDDEVEENADSIKEDINHSTRILKDRKKKTKANGKGGKNLGYDITTRGHLASLLSTKHAPDETACAAITAYLMSLTPPGVDREIQDLCHSKFDTTGKLYLASFLLYFSHEIEKKENFEVIQAYLNRFLNVHLDLIKEDRKCSEALDHLSHVQSVLNNSTKSLIQNTMCLLNYLTDMKGL